MAATARTPEERMAASFDGGLSRIERIALLGRLEAIQSLLYLIADSSSS